MIKINDIVEYQNEIGKVKDIVDDKCLIKFDYFEDLCPIDEVKKHKIYKLNADLTYSLLSGEKDINEYFNKESYSIEKIKNINFNLDVIYKGVNVIKNKNKNYHKKWMRCYRDTIDLEGLDESCVEDFILHNKIVRIIYDSKDFNEIYDVVVNHYNNLSLPLKDRYSDEKDILTFLQVLFEAEGKYSEEINEAYRYYLNMECFDDTYDVLHMRAYSYYGGNSACPCDYKKAEEALLKLYEMGETFAANSLGYIYYYGRVNNGVPEYEKAYKYFTVSALDGEPEAIIKLSDMFNHGYGIRQNKHLAFKMLHELKTKELARLEIFGINKFADIALRVGSMYEKDFPNLEESFKYYSMAKSAMKIRNKYYPNFGDNVVNQRIDEAYERITKLFKYNRLDNIFEIINTFLSDTKVTLTAISNKEENKTIISLNSLGQTKLITNFKNGKTYFSDQLDIIVNDYINDVKFSLNDGAIWCHDDYLVIESDKDFIEFPVKSIKLKLYNEVK